MGSLILHSQEKIARHLEAEPAGSHAGGYLEEVGHDALVKSPDAFLRDDHGDGVPD